MGKWVVKRGCGCGVLKLNMCVIKHFTCLGWAYKSSLTDSISKWTPPRRIAKSAKSEQSNTRFISSKSSLLDSRC